MTKQDILNTTGLSEEEFYQRYPDQETFCSDYPDMCPDMMDDEDVSNEYVVESDYDDSLYEAQDGVQTTAPYTDYNQYQNAMQNYYAEASKANAYNNFQNDLYNLSGKTKGFSETPKQMGDMFNTLSPEQQDAFAQKHGAEFITNTPSSNRKNYINSMQMTVPGKGTGYYSFPTNDVVYGRKDLERPKYDFPKMTAPQYPMPVTSPTNFQGKPINYQPGTATINLGNTNQQSKLNSLQSIRPNFQPTQIINNVGASYKDPASLNASNGNLPIPKYSLNRTMEKVGATNKPFVTSTPSYTSIVDLLKARKEDSSFTNRKRMAEEAGIKNYTGTASQNMDLINRINNSKASGAGMTSSSQLQNQTQQNNKPFYSPSNTPASYTNNDEQSYPAKKYTSIVDLFKDRGEDSSFSNRKKVAEKKGIKNYRGSAKQNVEFINRMDDFNPYSTEMELGGENMFVNGGLVKYQKKGEVKQNPPKIYTDRKMFEQAKKLYADSLFLHNNPVTVTRDFPGSIDIDLNKDVTSSFKNVTNPFGARYVAHPLKKTNKKLLNDLVEHQIKMRTVPDYGDDLEVFESNKKRNKTLIDSLLKMKKTGFQPVAATEPSYFGHTMFFKKPVQPVVFQSAPTHPIEHFERLEMTPPSLNGSNIQMQGQLLPIPQMRLPQRGNIPFYGPGNSIIGYTDGNMQFYPAQQYTGAPNNQLNLLDKELLDNPEMLQRYVLSRDNYNFELGGVNIHPAMRTNFNEGGLVKYQDKGEVKMTYRDFLNYVDYPEMIQVDGMRSAYEPETNTIFYDTPRSLPDELSHAVQRATGSFGYSVPPNYTTMMMKIPAMRENLKYKYNRENLDPELVNKNAGEYNTIRLKNVPSDSGNSLSNAYVKRYPADYKIAGDAFLKKLNDSNIYMVPGSVEQEAHQLFEPRIRQDFFNYFKPQYKQGGYYGMDGRLHRAKGSGTYVMNGGYYFDPGGENTKPPIVSPATPPGAMGDPIAVPQSSLAYNNSYQDYSFDMGANEADGSSMGYSIDTDTDQTNSSSMGQQSMIDPYDASKYSSAIDPSTGFTTWSKNNQALTNIKKQDPALWGHLKDEGKGARWRTGQTDFQKFGRTAGKIGNGLNTGIEIAGMFGNLINNRNQERNLNNSAINKGSTASMYTNPQAAGKGTGPGQTGSIYGMMDPDSIGARSFTGMYGKYGMQVPKYDIGGGFSNLFTSAQSVIPITKPMNLIPSGGSFTDSNGFNPFQNNMPIVDNTGVYQYNRAVNETDGNNNTVTTLDPDLALQAVAGFESGSKPGETKVGMSTKIVGEGGKKASASGTYQITEQTLHEIFNKDKSISSKYKNFNTFKNAFDTDSKVEYEAARSLMADHIKNYGIYALGAWYYPEFARKAAKGDKSVFDVVPRRDFGNRVKWGDDFKLKLDAYNKAAGTNYTPNTIFNAPKPATKTPKNSKNPPHTQQGTSWHADYNRFENPMLRPTLKEIMKQFPGTSLNGVWPSPEHLEQNPTSDHNTGDGLDVTIKDTNQGNQAVEKLIKDAKSKNIKYIIFNSRIWDAKTNTWSAYTGKNPHKTHFHVSFNPYRKKQLGGQVMEMDEDEITQFLKAGGQLEFLD